MYSFALSAALGCALCNGAAAVLQKMSADKETLVDSLDAGLLLRLAREWPYVLGVSLDLVGWGLTFFAVRTLPLFLVESVIALNIVVTALLERFMFRRQLTLRSYALIAIMLVGLVMLALTAAPDTARTLNGAETWSLLLIPLPLFALGVLVARSRSPRSAVGLAALSGVAFGMTSVVARIFHASHPWWHTVYNAYALVLVACGVLAILLFTVALQRAQATIMNAAMTATQTIAPAVIGVLLLGDRARHGLWILAIIGTVLSLTSALALAIQPPKNPGRPRSPTPAGGR